MKQREEQGDQLSTKLLFENELLFSHPNDPVADERLHPFWLGSSSSISVKVSLSITVPE
jgi:hypothetical protein